MEKNLIDVEKEYCNEVVKFFCKEYVKRYSQKHRSNNDRKEMLQNQLSDQIKNRLHSTNLIRNFRVDAYLFPVSEKRDLKIDNLLENKDENTESKIVVCLEYRDHTMALIEHLII